MEDFENPSISDVKNTESNTSDNDLAKLPTDERANLVTSMISSWAMRKRLSTETVSAALMSCGVEKAVA